MAMINIYKGGVWERCVKSYGENEWFVVYTGWHTQDIKEWDFFHFDKDDIYRDKNVFAYQARDAYFLYHYAESEGWPWNHVKPFKKVFDREPTEAEKQVLTDEDKAFLAITNGGEREVLRVIMMASPEVKKMILDALADDKKKMQAVRDSGGGRRSSSVNDSGCDSLTAAAFLGGAAIASDSGFSSTDFGSSDFGSGGGGFD